MEDLQSQTSQILQSTPVSISPEFYLLLKQYTKSTDPLEDPNFDIASYLNEKFPDFKSLEKLPNLIEDFEKQISELDEEIDNLMCERAAYNEEMKTYMNELNNDVGKIIELINNIKINSDINETTVKMICNDIKNLDNARNNITTTISSLTKLIMLITGIEKLETFVKEKSFKEAANAIAASNDIMEYFKEYRHVTQVNSLYQKKDHLCTVLLGTILDEFKANIELVPNNSDLLYDACLAINAIGDNGIKALKTWFTQYKLGPYEEIFDPKAASPVEFHETERRFEWLKRCLRDYNKLYDEIFPPSWGFKSQLCQDFCRISKLHLNEILMMNLEGKKKIEVEVLVNVLNNTISFEKNLHAYLIADFNQGGEQDQNNANVISLTHGIKSIDKPEYEINNNIEEIKAKYTEKTEKSNPNRIDPNSLPKYQPFRVLGIISESFEPYMISYVNNEEKKIKENIDGLKTNDRIEGKLYVSSLYLFNNIKQAMNRCLSFSKSKTFYDLCNKFKDVFKYYNDQILRMKYPMKDNLNAMTNTNFRLTDDDIKTMSYVINTSDYCITTIGALIESLKEKIEDRYKSSIQYDDIIDNLRQIYKTAYEILIQNLKNVINDQLASNMIKMSWTLGTNMSQDISQFVIFINKAFENNFMIVKDILQEEFICHFLNIVPKLITDALITSLYKIKKIDESGAQKLLTDVYEFKGMILKIYNIISRLGGVSTSISTSKENDTRLNCLNMIMRKEFGKIESRLKCLGSNVMEIGNAYKTFVEDKSKEDFDKLIAVRGIKKGEIVDYEKIFL